MRYMGLDYGSRTVGVAISDPSNTIAQPKEIIRRKEENKLRRTLARIEELIEEYEITEIVLGLPVNMDTSEGERAKLSLEFKDRIERRCGIVVHMLDERLTTVEADEIMDKLGIRGRERKEHVDMIAAELILQDYLDNVRK
ncbi:Holliday junction resolvase RuvX [Butyrivibrio sp. NC3005]|uniref:Holliday junction resolvase RuvX n=1 Tax=Butyrivibrio sp. NC3005 TaxID=1280685 RepID=UPI0004123FF9|nr:Holliday junction resolvase RuvX [Butyrivibrio sp. NC3005]